MWRHERARAGHDVPIERDLTRVGPRQAGNDAQQGRFAAPTRSENHDALTGQYVEGHISKRLMVSIALGHANESQEGWNHRDSLTTMPQARSRSGDRITAACRRARAATCDGGAFAISV